jgi:hypothetical protein
VNSCCRARQRVRCLPHAEARGTQARGNRARTTGGSRRCTRASTAYGVRVVPRIGCASSAVNAGAFIVPRREARRRGGADRALCHPTAEPSSPSDGRVANRRRCSHHDHMARSATLGARAIPFQEMNRRVLCDRASRGDKENPTAARERDDRLDAGVVHEDVDGTELGPHLLIIGSTSARLAI